MAPLTDTETDTCPFSSVPTTRPPRRILAYVWPRHGLSRERGTEKGKGEGGGVGGGAEAGTGGGLGGATQKEAT